MVGKTKKYSGKQLKATLLDQLVAEYIKTYQEGDCSTRACAQRV